MASFLDVKSILEQAARRYGYDPALLAGQAWAESGFDPEIRSKAGAVGLLQFMPATWAEWGKGGDPTNPTDSADAGVRYMRHLLTRYAATASPVSVALAAYNWGMGNVDRAMKQANRTDWEGLAPFLPAETRAYAPKILNRAAIYRAAFESAVGPVIAVGLLVFLLLRRVIA